MNRHADDALEALSSFIDEGWISQVLFEVKSGKEATVQCCAAGPRARAAPGGAGAPPLLAAKIYRPLESRRFRNDAVYQTGRVHLAREGRAKRAADSKSAFGRELQYAMWLEHEWETMHVLVEAGVDVPQPLARNDRAILMPFIGDEAGAAPNLIEAEFDRAEVARIVDCLLWSIAAMLDLDRVHGDLSAYNVLSWQGRAVIIDFPQAIDPRLNPAAELLLTRDIANICRWAAAHGVRRDGPSTARELWARFVLGEIG